MSPTPAIKRTIEISRASYVRVRDSQLVIEQDGAEVGTVPVEDIGVLLIDSPAVVTTAAALMACWKQNAVVILCDERHLPGAMLLPLEGHTLTARVMTAQVAAPEPRKKRLWQQIIKAKISAQCHVLEKLGQSVKPLRRLVAKVRSGDPANVEAQAARFYWPRLFGRSFRRDPDQDGANSLLNYGYAVVRAAVARSICAAGLSPALGLKHSNQYNAFCLADDLVEPLRPLVDLRVREVVTEFGDPVSVCKETKARILDLLSWPLETAGQKAPLLVATHQFAASVRSVLTGETERAAIPCI